MKKLNMNRHLSLLLILSACLSCNSKKAFIDASHSLRKKRLESTKLYKDYENQNLRIRRKLFKKGEIDFIDCDKPLFFIEGLDLETGEVYNSILNEKGQLNYIYLNNSYNLSNSHIFPASLLANVLKWETVALDSIYNLDIDGALSITATKITFDSNCSVQSLDQF